MCIFNIIHIGLEYKIKRSNKTITIVLTMPCLTRILFIHKILYIIGLGLGLGLGYYLEQNGTLSRYVLIKPDTNVLTWTVWFSGPQFSSLKLLPSSQIPVWSWKWNAEHPKVAMQWDEQCKWVLPWKGSILSFKLT